jgi:hypothetical protein
MNISSRKSLSCLECGYHPLSPSITNESCPICLNVDPLGKKAKLKRRKIMIGLIMLIVAFIFTVFYLIPFFGNSIQQNHAEWQSPGPLLAVSK